MIQYLRDVLAGTIGYAVDAVNGSLGLVADVRQEGATTFFVARAPSGRECLLPASVIEEIDVGEKRILFTGARGRSTPLRAAKRISNVTTHPGVPAIVSFLPSARGN